VAATDRGGVGGPGLVGPVPPVGP